MIKRNNTMKGMGMAQHQPMIMAHFLPIVSHVTPVMKLNTALPTPKKTAHNCISNVNMQSVQCCPYPENKYSMEYVPTKKKICWRNTRRAFLLQIRTLEFKPMFADVYTM